jgi:hypothetical protein
MWWSRLLIGISVTTVCAATSLSTGSGRAAAFDPEEIFAVAREIAAPVAETWRLPAFKDDVESLIARQGTNLTPVLDESGLTRFRNELMSSSPRKPLPDEVVPVRGEVPSAYREAQQMLCETTVDLFTDPDQLSWKYGIKRVDDQILNQSPVGEKLVLLRTQRDR